MYVMQGGVHKIILPFPICQSVPQAFLPAVNAGKNARVTVHTACHRESSGELLYAIPTRLPTPLLTLAKCSVILCT
jgi:hypothetical protein